MPTLVTGGALRRQAWPPWWDWELELTAHVTERMSDRSFTEIDLRSMLEATASLGRDAEPGCWRATTRHLGRRWVVVVTPDPSRSRLVVITAYPLESRPW